MKKIKSSLTICTFLMLIIIGFSNRAMFKSVQADDYFDTYGNISWAEERVRLYNFASFLEDDPDMVGYIGFYCGEKDEEKHIKQRVNRAKQFLVHNLKVKNERIIVKFLGESEKTLIILQPVSKDKPSPFSKVNVD